jgi:hypothetical protein
VKSNPINSNKRSIKKWFSVNLIYDVVNKRYPGIATRILIISVNKLFFTSNFVIFRLSVLYK